jgi:hypothetical protein
VGGRSSRPRTGAAPLGGAALRPRGPAH